MRDSRVRIAVGALFGAVLTLGGCGDGGDNHASPRVVVDDSFTIVQRERGRIGSMNTNSFNVATVGLDVSVDGLQIDVISKIGSWNRLATEGTVVDAAGGFATGSRGNTTAVQSAFTLHSSDDGGVTWRAVPMAPAFGESGGELHGLFRVDDAIYSLLWGSERRELVRLDRDTGRWSGAGFATEDGLGVVFGVRNASYRFGTITWPVFIADRGNFYLNTFNLRSGQFRQYSIARPECEPIEILGDRFDSYGVVATGVASVAGVCHRGDDEICAFWWNPNEENPDRPFTVGHCAHLDALRRPADYVVHGREPDVDPVAIYPSPGGLHILATIRFPGGEEARTRTVAFRFEEAGLVPYDLGFGNVMTEDFIGMRPLESGLFRVAASCVEALDGRCVGEEDAAGVAPPSRVYGWDDAAGAIVPVLLTPHPCAPGRACPDFYQQIVRVPSVQGKYFASYALSTGFEGLVERAVAVGFVHSPLYEPPPEPVDATLLELQCWAIQKCYPLGVLADVEHHRQCVERWRHLNSGSDAAYEAFVGADSDDCEALQSADPVGFVWPGTCSPMECDASGVMRCGEQWHCAALNGGACSTISGVSGCFADACDGAAVGDTSAEPFCDDRGRFVHCPGGTVDDCTSRGLLCDSTYGCNHADPNCDGSGTGSRCEGQVLVRCLGTGLAMRTDCSRNRTACQTDAEGYSMCVSPFVIPEPPRCDGDILYVDGRATDCSAVGMRCDAWPGIGQGGCVPR